MIMYSIVGLWMLILPMNLGDWATVLLISKNIVQRVTIGCAVINYCEADVPVLGLSNINTLHRGNSMKRRFTSENTVDTVKMAMCRITLSGSQKMKFCLKDTRQKVILK